jgi:hypothetical protein
MQNLNNKIQSYFLRIKDSWIFFLVFFILNLLLPLLVSKIKISDLTCLLVFLNYKLPVWSLIVSLFLAFIANKIYKKITNIGKLEILKASYGAGSQKIDITENLNKAIIDNKLKIVLSNNIAGDPIFGKLKRGIVDYKIGSKVKRMLYFEGEVIELP